MGIARTTIFEDGGTWFAADQNNELNPIYDLLSGISTAHEIYTRFSDATDPVWIVDQLGAGDIAAFRKAGADKVLINQDGQLESLLATGTAPFLVSSTTLVANLNAKYLDGLLKTQFTRNDAADSVKSPLQLDPSASGDSIIFSLNANVFELDSESAEIIDLTAIDSSPVISIATGSKLQVTDAASNAADVVSKSEFDAWNTHGYSWDNGAAGTLSSNYIFGHLIIPASSIYTITKIFIRCYGTMAGSGSNAVITFYQLASAGSPPGTSLGTVTINTTPNGGVLDTTYSTDIADVTLAANEVIYAKVTTANTGFIGVVVGCAVKMV